MGSGDLARGLAPWAESDQLTKQTENTLQYTTGVLFFRRDQATERERERERERLNARYFLVLVLFRYDFPY